MKIFLNKVKVLLKLGKSEFMVPVPIYLMQEMSRSSMSTHILNLLQEGAISIDNLEEFSDEVRNYFEQIMSQ